MTTNAKVLAAARKRWPGERLRIEQNRYVAELRANRGKTIQFDICLVSANTLDDLLASVQEGAAAERLKKITPDNDALRRSVDQATPPALKAEERPW